MPQNPPYFPADNASQDTWSQNFNTLLTANPTDYGLTAPDAVLVDAAVDAFHAAYLAAINPATRTPVTIAAKDAALANMKSVVLPYAVQIAGNPAVANGLKTGIGVTVRITTKTRNPVTLNEISLSFAYTPGGQSKVTARDTATPTTKARPLGAFGWQVQIRGRDGGAGPWTQFEDMTFSGNIAFPELEAEMLGFDDYEIRARWVGAQLPGGALNVGPWSAWENYEP